VIQAKDPPPRPEARLLGYAVLAVVGVALAVMGAYTAVMAGEGSRYDVRYRGIPTLR
jgi:hypothetical protein